MTLLRVWAPRPGKVELATGASLADRRPMARAEDGWWSIEAPDVIPGVDYAFSLDGGEPRPDPRAQRLPLGVHGPSQLLDHSAFRWTDAGWRPPRLADGVVYELHVGTFTPEGTFDGVVDRLDYLHDLGITHVELMPVNSFPGRFGWGYDGVGLYAPQEGYGGPDRLKRLVDAAHRRGLAVILDVVYNHFGPEGNYLDEFGPYRTERFQTLWGAAVNLDDRGADDVRRFLLDNVAMWLRDYHFDGLRLDAADALIDLTAIHFLEEMAREVEALERQLGRHLTLIAESDLNDPRLLRDRAVGGFGLEAQWSDDFHHALHVTLTGEQAGYYADFIPFTDLARALERTWVYQGQYSRVRGRRQGRPPEGLAPNRFLGYAQDHDQVGNRAGGERLSQLVDERLLPIAAALVLTAPFTPMLFAGEEWGASTPFQFFADYGDAGLRDAVRTGRQHEFESFGWNPADVPDPTALETFEHSRLDWAERERHPHRDLLDWYRRLIELRRSRPALRNGSPPTVQLDPLSRVVVTSRPGVVVAVNMGNADVHIPVPARPTERVGHRGPGVVASPATVTLENDQIALPARSVALLVDE